ncbi:MAG: N-acetylglucosamine-6-phosphate deacetylase, partial [Sinobacterium sp.]
MKSPNRILTKALFDGANHHYDKVLSVSKGVIVAVDNDISNHDVVLEGLVVPGYVDLQVNGGGGLLFNANPCIDSLKKIMQAHSQFGTTAMLPTIITDNLKTMVRAADIISHAIKDNMLGILGIHFEGPHISTTKKGAHSQEFIRPISEEEWKIFERKDIGHVLVTLAPEVVPIEDIKRLVSMGVHVCIGHSNATYEITNRAIEAGATGFTHLYNAMSAITGREAGVTGSALLNDHTRCGLIVDGHHVSVASCKLALKVKPVGGIFLVTDAMPPVGTQSTEFDFFDRIVTCHKGKLTS